jgi:hypothetical protein
MFNQDKRVGTAPLRLKTDLEVRLGHGVRWRMLAKFRRETLHGFEQSAAVGTYLHSPRGHVVDRDAAAVLNMLWKITPEGAAKAVWWDVKEARKKLKKGIVSREAVGKANPIIPRPYTRHLGLAQGAEGRRQMARAAPMTPARGDGAVNRPSGLGGGQVYNDTDTKAGF